MTQLEVQKYLRNGGTLESLEAELGITSNIKDSRVILNYSQIDSPKSHLIVRECRGLVLELGTWDIVAKAFTRFFNVGEVEGETEKFNFNDFSTMEKVDGSLLLLYNYKGEWHTNTRNSYSTALVGDSPYTWRQIFEMGFDTRDLVKLDPSVTYVCELCSRYNKIVRDYPEPQLFLLACFNKTEEVSVVNQELFAKPETYTFTSVDEIKQYIEDRSVDDCTYEGVVIKDSNGNRLKLKAKFYTYLHHCVNNGVLTTRRVLEMYLDNEHHEFLLYYPEHTDKFLKVGTRVDGAVLRVGQRLEELKNVSNQKEFALAIADEPLKSLMFTCRKTGISPLDCIKQNQKHFAEYIDKQKG